jgi:hypothetical protein
MLPHHQHDKPTIFTVGGKAAVVILAHLKIPIPVTGRLLRLMPCACIARSLSTVDHINDMGKSKRTVFYSSWVFLIQFLNDESNKSISIM